MPSGRSGEHSGAGAAEHETGGTETCRNPGPSLMAMTTAARPGGLIPEHLWLADDEDKLVVSVLAPEVAGPAEHDTVGPVTKVSPHPVSRPGGMYRTRPA